MYVLYFIISTIINGLIFRVTDDGGLTNIFKELTAVQTSFESLDKVTLRSAIKAFNNTSLSVDDLSEKFGGLDNSVVEYLNSTERGQASVDGFSKSIDNTATSMGLASVKAKLLATAMNMITTVAITLAIRGIIWALDELIVTFDEQKEKLDDAVQAYEKSETELKNINNELKTTSERIDELNGKENLTFTEQDELQKLIKTNDELERKIFLLEQANKEAEKEVVEEAQDTYKKYTNNRNIGAVEQIDFYANSSLLENGNWDNFKNDLPWLVAQYQKQQEALAVAQENGWTSVEEKTRANLELLEGYMSEASLDYQDLYDKIGNISENAMTDDLKVAKQDLNDILDIVAELLGYGGERAETSFDDIWNSDEFSQYKTELVNLSKEGKLDASVLESNENYRKLLESTGATAEDTAQHINALASEIDQVSDSPVTIVKWDFKETLENLDKAKESLSVLDETFSKLFDGDKKTNIGYEDYSAIAEAFSNVSGIDNYITKLQEAGNNTKQVTAVMEDLIGAYLDQSKILENVTEENKDLVISMLEEMGIANAEQIVLSQLNHETEMLAIQKQFVTEKGYELANATIAEYTELINEADCSDVTKQALAQLALEKINVNKQTIDTSSDIDNVIALANAAMASASAIAKLEEAKKIIGTVEQYGALNVARYRAGITTAQYNEAKAIIESIENGTFDYDFQSIDPNKYKVNGTVKPTYSPQKTPGTSTYEALEKANDAMKKQTKTIDFFEERVKKLNNAIELLETNLENVTGAFAKNNLIDAQIGLNAEKINNYSDALAMYTQKANESLSKLPSDVAAKLKNGAVSVSDYIDDENGSISEAISNYQNWADKIADCKQELAGLKEAIRDLELAKFNNIMQDFTDQFDLHEGSKDLIDKQIALFKEAGQLIGESFYAAQIDQTKKQLALLEEEKKKLSEQMTSAVTSGRIEVGTDEWLEMVNSLKEVEGSILDAKTALEEFDNELLNLHTEIFKRIQDQFGNLHSELENLEGLFDDFDVSGDKGGWSDEGLTRLGLLAQQYELSRYQIEQYNDEIDLLNKQYAEGRYSATEYSDKLAELSQAQWECVNSSESIKDAIIELNQARIDEEIEGIEEEIDKFSELIEAQKEALNSRKELEDYKRQIADKSKSVEDLERQIAAMQNDTSASTVAKRKLLEQQLADARRDLEDTEREHSYNSQIEALDKELENYQNEKDAEIETLRQSLEDRETLIFNSMESVKQNSSIVGEEIKNMAEYHGITISDAIITSWQNGENAIASYGAVLSAGSSAFIGNIMGVENEVYALQYQANATADSLAWMFATRADNLVGQLTDSYYSEANLNAMTNALQDSLVGTLERGYDVSGITSALNSIAAAADNARRSIEAMNKTPYNPPEEVVVVKPNVSAHPTSGGGGTHLNSSFMQKYASGVHNLNEDELAWTQEYGQEMILSPTRNAVLTPLKQGDTVLTKAQTDAIYEWSKLNPNTFVPNGMRSMLSNASKIQPIANNSSPTLEFNGTLMHIDKVDSTNIKQMESIANKAVDRLVNKMSDGIRYRSM